VTYNIKMEHDETLDEFVQILGRIKDLLGEEPVSAEEGIDFVAAIEGLRQTGSNEDADELAALLERADELKAQHEVNS